MTITRAKYRAKALNMLRNYERSFDEHSWRGGGDPMLVPDIEARFELKRARFVQRLTELLINEALGTEAPAITDPEPMSAEEEAFHRRNGTIV